jgi:hypothetical protein
MIKKDRNVKELWKIACINILILVSFRVLLCETFINPQPTNVVYMELLVKPEI